MAKKVVEETSLTSIANAIREKTGASDALVFPMGMVEAIAGIETGGGAELDGFYILCGKFTPAEDISTKYTIASTSIELGLPENQIKNKFKNIFMAVWSVGGYLESSTHVNAAMGAPLIKNNSTWNNGTTGAVLTGINTVTNAKLFGNSIFDHDYLSINFTENFKAKAGIEYAWVAFIPK